MTGSLQIKNDKFYIVLNTQANGRRKPLWIPTGLEVKGNRRRAEQLLRKEIEKCELQHGIVRYDTLFSTYIRHWLTVVEPTIDEVTFQSYSLLARKHVIPYFEERQTKLQEVDRPTIQAFLNSEYKNGRLDGTGGLSPASIKRMKTIVNQALIEAVRDNIIITNPCKYVTLPKQQRYQAKYYNAQQLDELFEAIKDEPIYPLLRIATLYGLRRSELLGLKWDSLDFDNGTITIMHTVTKVSSIVEKDKTKNASSHRSFPMTDEARQIFETAKAEEEKYKPLFGNVYVNNDYVFKWPDGRPYSPDYVSKKFSKLLNEKGLPHIRFHELRHSCASLLISLGYSLKDVQEWLGHSDIKVTANIYSHLDVKRKINMADSLEKTLSQT